MWFAYVKDSPGAEWKMSDDADLLAVRVATAFVLNDAGRIAYENAPDRSAGARLYLAGSVSGNVVRIRHDVSDATARALEVLAADEPPLRHPESTPTHLDEYVHVLDAESPVPSWDLGLMWSFAERLNHAHPAQLVTSGTLAGDHLLARLLADGMPPGLAALGFVDIGEFWAPWCVALHQNEIASIAFAARLGPAAAEIGVATVPPFRGRGFAAAAAAGWAALPALQGRALFYSTQRANASSQRVVERLALRFLGATLSIT
jgi:hypothetical protein